MTTRSLVALSAGLSQPSSTRLLANQLVQSTVETLEAQGVTTTVTVIELRDLAHDVTDALLTGFPSVALRSALDAVRAADGIVAVTPIFSASYSGLFKSFIDVLDIDALAGTPVLLAATAGSARHSLTLEHALRPLFAYLRAVTTPTAVFAASEDWGTGVASGGDLRERVNRAASEFAGLVARHEPVNAPVDLAAAVVPFAEQLRVSG